MRKSLGVFMVLCLVFCTFPLYSASAAADVNAKPKVIPSLREWSGGSGNFTMTSGSRIVIDAASCACKLPETAKVLQEDLKEMTGYDLPVVASGSASAAKGDFLLLMNKTRDDSIGDEGYAFEAGDFVSIRANTETGVFYGTRTALQILEQDPSKASIVKGTAKDYPKYKERGFMLDVGRKFFPMSFLKDYAKFMSYYKMNDFQLHLNDNEIFSDTSRANWNKYSAFRLESTKYPELTAKDGSYSKQDFRELQDIAGIRGVTITPEFDTPSHALAFTKVRPDLVKDNLPVDHLDITRPEAVDFVKDVWSEYLDGKWFDSGTVHFGADEFDRNDKSTYEKYRQFLNEMNAFFKSKGKQARMWGSLKQFPGTTPVDTDIITHGWSNGWQDPVETVNQGYNIINTLDSYLYIVPKASYYHDYLDSQWLYNNWDPTVFGGSLNLKDGEPKLLGGMFAVWNDLLGKKVTADEVHDRVKQAMPVLAEKMWRGLSTDTAYSDFKQLAGTLGEGPGTQLMHTVDSATDLIVHYPLEESVGTSTQDQSGNGYDGKLNEVDLASAGKTGKAGSFHGGSSHISTGLGDVGFPWTASAWVKLEEQQQEGEAIFMESDYGALKLKQKTTGKAGFTREGYDFSFNASIPTGRWVHVAFRGDLKGTSLYVDGELKASVADVTRMPAAFAGSRSQAFTGMLDDLKLYKKALTGKEIALEAGSPPWTVNIAAHKPASASSIEVPQFKPELAFDENEDSGSRWSSGYTDNEWLQVDLGQMTDIGKVIIKWENAYAKGYKIQVSDKGEQWRDVYATSAGVGGTEVIKFPTEQARYVRMQGTKRSGTYGFSLYELEVYPPNPGDEVPAPVPIRYTQDFENNSIGGWQHAIGTGVGSMAVVDAPGGSSQHALKLTANNVNNMFVDQNSPLIKDGEIEFKVTPESDVIRTGIVFRYVDENTWASVGFDKNAWYWVNAQDNYGAMTTDQGALLKKGETATVKVKFEGTYITLIVNGKTYFEGALPKLPADEGKMGARVFGPAVAIFDDFKYANNVAEVPVTGIKADPAEISLKVGDKAELKAAVQPSNASNKQVSWSSSDESVAKVEIVNGKAEVSAVKEGSADITAVTAAGGYKAVVKVTVTAEAQHGVSTVLRLPSSIEAGQSFTAVLGLQDVGSAVYAQDLTVQYDAEKMEFVEAKPRHAGVDLVETKHTDGTVRLILASQGAGHEVKQAGDMVELTFTTKPLSEPTKGFIRVAAATLGDAEGSELEAGLSSAEIEITRESTGISGDINGDGKVSIGDLAIVAASYGKTSADADWNQAKRADVNHDGKIDLTDLVLVARNITS
ncbi:family 20 glycosylhydrolase [Paenibacillus sp. HJL G12]|uniref:Beta-N-acetylhexosaminidase n=1 Tax=Paenibacillus dendrobii TaxID=2691084 RepID=A0A7X3IIV1_9BACL|nr:family 20 glycosylhydrolase [Paenibacillus dendrobii]MWV44778.1 family 20 glycosylhydrolase [Paenibacillus dendrobii]